MKEEYTFVNLNHGTFANFDHSAIKIHELVPGVNRFVVEAGKNKKYLEVERLSRGVVVELYNYVSEDRNSFSKHDEAADLKAVYFNDKLYCIDRELIKDFDKIYHATRQLRLLGYNEYVWLG